MVVCRHERRGVDGAAAQKGVGQESQLSHQGWQHRRLWSVTTSREVDGGGPRHMATGGEERAGQFSLRFVTAARGQLTVPRAVRRLGLAGRLLGLGGPFCSQLPASFWQPAGVMTTSCLSWPR